MRTFLDMVVFLPTIPDGQSREQRLALIDDILFLLGCIDWQWSND
jgi:hypothetical protein